MHISFHNIYIHIHIYIYNSHFRNREGCTFPSGPPPLLPLLLMVGYLEPSFIGFSEMYYLVAKLNEKKLIYLEFSTNHNVSSCFNFVFCFTKLYFIFKEVSFRKFRISDICISLRRCYLFNDSAKFNDFMVTKFIFDTAKKLCKL